MTQPNVFWTLEAPFLTIIGLYSNVPEDGEFDDVQVNWLVDELRSAPANNALIIAVHHPPYSVGRFWGGNAKIGKTLDKAFEESQRCPDLILNAHVNNYQRFTRRYQQYQIPYIVVGAGGYPRLHRMSTRPDGSQIEVPYSLPESKVTLEKYDDKLHGYLTLRVTANSIMGSYYGVETRSTNPIFQRIDSFELDLRSHKLISKERH